MRLTRILLAAIALVVVLAGCLGARPAGTPNPDPVCDAAASLQAALADMRRMDPSTPIDDYKIAAAGAAAAYDQLVEELGNFSEELTSTLAAAMRDLETAAEQLPDDITVEQATDLLSEELEAVRVAWQALSSELGCRDVEEAG